MLDKHFQNSNFENDALWISYRLLECESKKVVLDYESKVLTDKLLWVSITTFEN